MRTCNWKAIFVVTLFITIIWNGILYRSSLYSSLQVNNDEHRHGKAEGAEEREVDATRRENIALSNNIKPSTHPPVAPIPTIHRPRISTTTQKNFYQRRNNDAQNSHKQHETNRHHLSFAQKLRSNVREKSSNRTTTTIINKIGALRPVKTKIVANAKVEPITIRKMKLLKNYEWYLPVEKALLQPEESRGSHGYFGPAPYWYYSHILREYVESTLPNFVYDHRKDVPVSCVTPPHWVKPFDFSPFWNLLSEKQTATTNTTAVATELLNPQSTLPPWSIKEQTVIPQDCDTRSPLHVFVIAAPFTGSSALLYLLTSSKHVTDLCANGEWQCEGNWSLVKMGFYKRLSRWDPNVPENWENAVKQEFEKYWNLTAPIRIEKSPCNLPKMVKIYKQLTSAGRRVLFVMLTRSACSLPSYYSPEAIEELLMEMMHYHKEISEIAPVIHIRYEELLMNPFAMAEHLTKHIECLGDLNPYYDRHKESGQKEPPLSNREMNIFHYALNQSKAWKMENNNYSTFSSEAMKYFGYL